MLIGHVARDELGVHVIGLAAQPQAKRIVMHIHRVEQIAAKSLSVGQIKQQAVIACG